MEVMTNWGEIWNEHNILNETNNSDENQHQVHLEFTKQKKYPSCLLYIKASAINRSSSRNQSLRHFRRISPTSFQKLPHNCYRHSMVHVTSSR